MKKGNESGKQGEREAVFTTIVGGRPPGNGTDLNGIPRGIEVLLKKASVDPAFRRMLLHKRGEAAKAIDLELSKAEAAMLAGIPEEQLERIIDSTKVKPKNRAVFLGKVGMLMLAAVAGAALLSSTCTTMEMQTKGIRPDKVEQMQQEAPQEADSNESSGTGPDGSAENQTPPVFRGIQPDRPAPRPAEGDDVSGQTDNETQPDAHNRLLISKGIRPDRPEPKG